MRHTNERPTPGREALVAPANPVLTSLGTEHMIDLAPYAPVGGGQTADYRFTIKGTNAFGHLALWTTLR